MEWVPVAEALERWAGLKGGVFPAVQEYHALASTAAGDLVNLLMDGQRVQEALGEVERMATLTVQAGLGPWTQLLDQVRRLRILSMLGRQEEVLREVGRLRDLMAGLPEQPGSNERVTPWNVRETLLDTGFHAAIGLDRWQGALALLDEQVESKRRRGAGRLDVARTRFNANGPLLRLERLGEAHQLLLECQQVFSQESDLRMLGMVFSARVDLEDELGHLAEAVELGKRALRYTYLAGDVDAIAASLFNLAICLGRAGRRPDALPHRLAAALIWFQTESGDLAPRLTALGRDLAETLAPPSFADLCTAVEQVEGVRFREFFERLPQRAASGDEALAQVLALAAQLPNPGPDIEGHLARWQPIIDTVVTATAPTRRRWLRTRTDRRARQAVEQTLAELAQNPDWAALAAAIRRVLDGERDEDALAAGLDAIDTAILHQILAGIEDAAGGRAVDG